LRYRNAATPPPQIQPHKIAGANSKLDKTSCGGTARSNSINTLLAWQQSKLHFVRKRDFLQHLDEYWRNVWNRIVSGGFGSGEVERQKIVDFGTESALRQFGKDLVQPSERVDAAVDVAPQMPAAMTAAAGGSGSQSVTAILPK
jgi:hypothetical protein